MGLILNLETSSEMCSVCIAKDGEVLAIEETDEQFSHTRKTTVFIQDILDEAELGIKAIDAIGISHGPGSYTGLRVAAATAKGICYGLKIPLVAIPTLEAIAYHTRKSFPGMYYAPMIDARRMEVYACVFNQEMEMIRETNNIILDDQNIKYLKFKESIIACGTGVEKAEKILKENGISTYPFRLSASFLAELSEKRYQNQIFENILAYEPLYFKAPKVTKSKKPLF
jgi:tRNA threonylcarbamoyladenosine biosynthesis protein TsaB